MKTSFKKIEKNRLRIKELSHKQAFQYYVRHGGVPPLWQELVNASSTEEKFFEYLARFDQVLSYKTVVDRDKRTTTRYVWHTQHDGRVRSAHAANDGKIFSWSEPPATGHPGEAYNCRCRAEPYVAGATEFATHSFSSGLAASYDRWSDWDFVHHYYYGEGRPVTLLEIGHLREVAEQYAYQEGVFRRLSNQIADAARDAGVGPLWYNFSGVYDFGSVQFSHGDSMVDGSFRGGVEVRGDMLLIKGENRFIFRDVFKDPLDMDRIVGAEMEVGGTPYEISGEWTANFSAEIFKDETSSRYRS